MHHFTLFQIEDAHAHVSDIPPCIEQNLLAVGIPAKIHQRRGPGLFPTRDFPTLGEGQHPHFGQVVESDMTIVRRQLALPAQVVRALHHQDALRLRECHIDGIDRAVGLMPIVQKPGVFRPVEYRARDDLPGHTVCWGDNPYLLFIFQVSLKGDVAAVRGPGWLFSLRTQQTRLCGINVQDLDAIGASLDRAVVQRTGTPAVPKAPIIGDVPCVRRPRANPGAMRHADTPALAL